jgi:hypothetical protein
MSNEPVDKIYGTSMSEHIALVPGELPRDAVGLWQIVPAGVVRFGLSGQDLTDYVRRNIFALVDAGAVPVKAAVGSGYEWDRMYQFGNTRELIAAAVIAEWQRIGNDPGDLAGSIWFALPRTGQKYVKMG